MSAFCLDNNVLAKTSLGRIMMTGFVYWKIISNLGMPCFYFRVAPDHLTSLKSANLLVWLSLQMVKFEIIRRRIDQTK